MDDQVGTKDLVSEANQQVSQFGYKKILVAVDYLNLTVEVFEKAMELAQTYNSKLMVFHSVQGDIPGVPIMDNFGTMGIYSEFYSQEMNEFSEKTRQEATEKLLTWLHSFLKQAKQRNILAECDYKFGDPGQSICTMAQNWEADLIVIGRRGRSGVSELLLGSVSNYVLHHAQCCVLVVQHG